MAVLGIVALIQIARGAANLGIDFAGGTAVQLKFDQAIQIDEARKALEANGLGNCRAARIRSGEQTPDPPEGLDDHRGEDRRTGRGGLYARNFPANHFVVDSSTEIGPTIGKKLQQDALIAVLISFAGIILYVAARFELRFGVAAALATFHDVLAVLGAFYILDKEITLLVVTALLTLAGYSTDGYGRGV